MGQWALAMHICSSNSHCIRFVYVLTNDTICLRISDAQILIKIDNRLQFLV